MKKKILYSVIGILLILIILFGEKNFLIKQYFITKLEKVHYDEYILNYSRNGKKTNSIYVNNNLMLNRFYDDNENLTDTIQVTDYNEKTVYEYNVLTKEKIAKEFIDVDTAYNKNVNNLNVLSFLTDENNKFEIDYLGIENINSNECYVLQFKETADYIVKFWINKKFLYTMRIDIYMSNANEDKNYQNNHIIFDYMIDLDLKGKEIFNIN